jgi:UDP-N-acetylglucosamine 2-epimerase (non-hydrolysing)/GDP/UDP-N,N'-diacetylbacillosamine 2-epimerase (hydrolysing)
MTKRIVAVFTGNRAEYGLQLPILRAIDAHPSLDYRLIVSGAHLDENFGRTLEEIEEDGYKVHAEVKIEIKEDTLYSTAQAIGSGILSMSEALNELRPDLLTVYADRFEGFAAVIAGTQMNIPTAHIEGGDLTEGGALDDSVRHAMTKLSHLHFTTNRQATNRILAMGEEPWRIHTVGFPAIDLIKDKNFANKEELQNRFKLDLTKPIVIFTQHSVTTEFGKAGEQIEPSLRALKRLSISGVQVVITYPNNDAGGQCIIDHLYDFMKSAPPNIQLHRSVGRYNYHGILALALDQEILFSCVGNSSSGIKETPAFGCPTVNIGSRQDGRLRAENVIDVKYGADAIFKAVNHCFEDKNFRDKCRSCQNPYGLGDAGKKISEVLSKVSLDGNLLRKRMTLDGEE